MTGRAAVLALVLAALVVPYASSLKTWFEQRDQIAQLETEVADRERAVEQYEQRVERWEDPAYVEARARERFGWVMPGEVGYVVADDGNAGHSDEGAGSEEEEEGDDEPDRPWWRTLWGSVADAGDPPEPEQSEPEREPEPVETIDPDDANPDAGGTDAGE